LVVGWGAGSAGLPIVGSILGLGAALLEVLRRRAVRLVFLVDVVLGLVDGLRLALLVSVYAVSAYVLVVHAALADVAPAYVVLVDGEFAQVVAVDEAWVRVVSAHVALAGAA
jgi:hypothetical protein